MNSTLSAARTDELQLISYLLATGEHPPLGLTPRHLQDSDNAAILAAMIRIRDEGETASLGAVAQRLISIMGLTNSNGQEWTACLDILARNKPYIVDIRGWVSMIARASMARMQIESAEIVIEMLRNGDEDGAAAEVVRLSTMFQAPAAASLRIRTAGELVRDFTELRRPVIHDLLRLGETMNIISAPKFGKSWLVLGLVLSVATGLKWLGRFWTTKGRVLLIDNELHPETLASRLPRVAESMGLTQADYDQHVCVVNLRGDLQDLVGLSAQLIELKPGEFNLIVLDAWYRLQPSGTDENSNGDVTQLYNLLDSVASKIGCAFACVHHTSKGNQSGKSVTDMGSGAGAQARAPDTHLTMRAHEADGAVVVEAAVRSWKPLEPFCMRWEFPAWSVANDLDPKDLRSDRPRKKSEAGDSDATSPDEAKRLKVQAGRLKVLESYAVKPDGETESKIAAGAGMNTTRLAPFQVSLIGEGLIEACKVPKGNGGTYPGFRITTKGLGELGQLRQLGHNIPLSNLSDTTRTGALSLKSTVCLSSSDRDKQNARDLSEPEFSMVGNLFRDGRATA